MLYIGSASAMAILSHVPEHKLWSTELNYRSPSESFVLHLENRMYVLVIAFLQ